MSEVTGTLDFLGHDCVPAKPKIDITDKKIIECDIKFEPFSISKFQEEIREISEDKNLKRAQRPNQNITGYDIAHNCMQNIIFKLRNIPVESYADKWLPIHMRSSIGTGIHEFIQRNTQQFTEIEPNIIVPSIGFYGKIDGLIGPNILAEIKSCAWSDYSKIISSQKPRQKDYLQAMTYSFILEKFCDETRSSESKKRIYKGGCQPKLEKYNINKIQFIYIAHDIFSADLESTEETLVKLNKIKKKIRTKNNPFYFISSLVLNITEEEKIKTFSWIEEKFNTIHKYITSNTDPTSDDPFLDTTGCFFCRYKQVCNFSS